MDKFYSSLKIWRNKIKPCSEQWNKNVVEAVYILLTESENTLTRVFRKRFNGYCESMTLYGRKPLLI